MISKIKIQTVFFLTVYLLVCAGSFPAFAKTAPASEEEFLDLIQRKSFDYFVQERNPVNGLVRDRARNFQRDGVSSPGSIAAVGFALSAYPVGVSRDWMDYGTARDMTLTVLRFFWEKAPQEHGFFYHFLSVETGERVKNSELSPIDTALFLAGALFASEYYEDPAIRELVQKIYARIDWKWMLHDGKTFAMSWSPETGFQSHRWDHYNESMILYLLAIGAPAHAIPASSWKEIARPAGSYAGYHVIEMGPLFTHQYSHIWVDFRQKNDGFADYFKNSIDATLANRAFCIDNASKFKSYSPETWGLTASDGPDGYKAYGALPGQALHDGTVAPTACGSSIVFTPEESLACLKNIYENVDGIWGTYGFADSFNIDRKWVARDVIGIDQGALLLMIENYRTQLIWKIMSKNDSIQQAMKAVGFQEGTMDLPWPDPPVHEATFLPKGLDLNGSLSDWPSGDAPIILDQSNKEMGEIKNAADLGAQIRFGWNKEALFFYAKVTDESLIARKTGRNIWMDDMVEIYIDPQGDGLIWNDKKDIQLGFRPDLDSPKVSTWSWFGDEKDPQQESMIYAANFADASGYIIEGAIRWEFLGVLPEADHMINISVAVHDVDKDNTSGKLHWFFRNENGEKRYVLGRVLLKR